MPVPSQSGDNGFDFDIASGSTNESNGLENWTCKEFNVFEFMHEIQGIGGGIGLEIDSNNIQEDYDSKDLPASFGNLIGGPFGVDITEASSFNALTGDLDQLAHCFGDQPLDLTNKVEASETVTPPVTTGVRKSMDVPRFSKVKTSFKQEPSLRPFIKPATASGLRCVYADRRNKPEKATIFCPKNEPIDHDYEPVKKRRAYRRVTSEQVKQDPNYRRMRQKNSNAVRQWRVNVKLAREESANRLAFLEQEYLKDTRYLQQLQEHNLALEVEAARIKQSCRCMGDVSSAIRPH